MTSKLMNFTFLIAILLPLISLFSYDHSHSKFNTILKDNVIYNNSKSTVNYNNIKSNKKYSNLLKEYIFEIENVNLTEYNTWNVNKKLSFLINSYNALTIKLILTKYPDLKSIKDLGSWLTSPWKKEFFTFLGKKSSLDYIEHEILRKDFIETRIHFAIVCASIGCPPLKNEAFTHDKLNEQLIYQTNKFINDKDRNYYNSKEKTFYVSKIFDWFEDDFIKSNGSVTKFILKYYSNNSKNMELFKRIKYDIEYLDYDWNLNDVIR